MTSQLNVKITTDLLIIRYANANNNVKMIPSGYRDQIIEHLNDLVD